MTTGVTEPAGPCGAVLQHGWYVLPHREGLLVTNELVQQLLDEADFEMPGRKHDNLPV